MFSPLRSTATPCPGHHVYPIDVTTFCLVYLHLLLPPLQPILYTTHREIFCKAVLWSECLCPSKIHVKMLTFKGDGSRWGLWEVARSWGWSPPDGISAFLTSDTTELPTLFPHVRIQWDVCDWEDSPHLTTLAPLSWASRLRLWG